MKYKPGSAGLIGKRNTIAVAEGKVVPQTYLKIEQPSKSGMVQEILIHVGQEVKAAHTVGTVVAPGTVLMILVALNECLRCARQ